MPKALSWRGRAKMHGGVSMAKDIQMAPRDGPGAARRSVSPAESSAREPHRSETISPRALPCSQAQAMLFVHQGTLHQAVSLMVREPNR